MDISTSMDINIRAVSQRFESSEDMHKKANIDKSRNMYIYILYVHTGMEYILLYL